MATWPWQQANGVEVQSSTAHAHKTLLEIAHWKCIHKSFHFCCCAFSARTTIFCSSIRNALIILQEERRLSIQLKEQKHHYFLFTFLSHSGGILIPHTLLWWSFLALRDSSTWLVWQLGAVYSTRKTGSNAVAITRGGSWTASCTAW